MREDINLVREVLNGNIDSLNILIAKYEKAIYRFVYNIINDKEASQDITQEVFITMYNKLYTYRQDSKFSNWIFKIARNKCIDYMRKYKRTYEVNIEDAIGIESREISPEQWAEGMETRKLAGEFINNLEGIDKQIIILRYSSDDITFADIAQMLNITESAVKRRFYRMRDKFKVFLAGTEKRCGI